MRKRHIAEIDNHINWNFNIVEGDCHCLRGIGVMRKSRPYDSCSPNQHCVCCEMDRQEKHLFVKRQRHEAKLQIAEFL